MYKTINSTTIGIYLSDFENLPVNDKGFHIAENIENGQILEVYDSGSGKIINKYEVLDNIWIKAM